MTSSAPLHDAVKPLKWLLGKWESVQGEGFYPTIQPFSLKESITFSNVGLPMMQFSSSALDVKNKPFHSECGFLQVNVGTKRAAFLSSVSNGVVEMAEGEVNGTELSLESTSVSNVWFAKGPKTTKITRTFKLINANTLEQKMSMATSVTPDLAPHFQIQYKKIE
ncbi:peroxynitrite isomerase THAP4-like [Diadema antillarum]|uniref:peroxynitrite isomerase THAP4-like n=1 Tax=Diadema antillarum TaxID=105358 RepID=UPI003A86D42D